MKTLVCNECRTPKMVPDSFQGESVNCSKCGAVIFVPRTPTTRSPGVAPSRRAETTGNSVLATIG